MNQHIDIGNYRLARETRGIGVTRITDPDDLPVRPLLLVYLDEPEKPSALFKIDRLLPVENGTAAEFVGHTTEKVYLVGRLTAPSQHNHGGLNLRMTIQNTTEEMTLRLRAQIILPGEAEPRWLVPGFFYKDNRPDGCGRLYPGFSELGHDPRRLISHNWAFRSDRAAIPAVFCWTFGCFAWIATEGVFGQSRELPRGYGISGLHLGVENGQPVLSTEFPYRETPAKYSFCHETKTEPEELFVNLPVNTPLSVVMELGVGRPDLHAYAPVMKALYFERGERHAMRLRAPAEESEQAAHVGLLRWHYVGKTRSIYESAVFDLQFGRDGSHVERPHMHAGWLSGALPAFALLWAGRESGHNASITAGIAVIDKITSALSPAGTIFPVWTEDSGWACSFGPEEGTAHSRTVAEAALFIIRALNLQLHYHSNHPQWTEAVKSTLNYATGAQREDGAFPAYFDLSVGRPVDYRGVGGLPWVAAAAAGYALFQIPHLKELAVKGGAYYATFLLDEFLYGSVEDQPLVPTSDDAHWALISYILLYEVDRDPRWLDLARRAADLALTWRMGYNILFEPEALAARYNLRTRGGDIGSVASPTLGCNGLLSYREMIRLAQYTGDSYYLRRAEDARLYGAQMICREDGQYNARRGMAPGQLFHTDWWQPKGMLLSLSHAMTGALVKYTELVRRKLKVDAMVVKPDAGDDIDGYKSPVVTFSDMAIGEFSAPPAAGSPAAGGGPGSGAGRQLVLSGLFSPSAQEALQMAAMEDLDREGDGEEQEEARPPSLRQVLSERGINTVPPSLEDDGRRVPNPFNSPSPRGRSQRGLSSDQVPLPTLSSEPVPFPDSAASSTKPAEEGDSDEDVEIKYKIF